MALNLGAVVRLTYTVKDAAGVLTTPSGRTITITQPDGTTASSPTITVPGTGLLQADFTPAQVGLHAVAWATTGPTTADTDVFTVEAAGVQLISVDEQLEHMRAAGIITGSVSREIMQDKCIAATAAVEGDLYRYIVPRTVVALTSVAANPMRLKGPVISITSVTIDGAAAVDPATYYVDGGQLYSRYGWGSSSWPGVATITYRAGYQVPPPAVREVAKGVAQGLWQSSQVGFHPGLDEAVDTGGLIGASVAGLPDPLRAAYEALRPVGVA